MCKIIMSSLQKGSHHSTSQKKQEMRFRTGAEKKNRSSKNPQKLLAKVALQSFEESKIVGVKIRISTSRMVKLGCYQSRLLSPGGFFLVFGNLRKMRTGFVVVEKPIMKYQLGACFIEI